METENYNTPVKPQSTYINPYTDFGFKKLFGEEGSKDLLIDFLNQLLPKEYQIKDLEFRNTEMPTEIPTLRKVIFDIHCENEKKDKFVVEMQKSPLEFFKDRVILYMTFPIRNQAPKGGVIKKIKGEKKKVDWNFKLQPVYFVGVLDFEFDTDENDDEYILEVEYKDQNNKVFYDKLKYFFVVMPRFNKEEKDLKNQKDKWIYFLKNLESFESIPEILNEPIFQKGFELAKISNYDEKQLFEYEQSYNDYLSLKASLDYSFNDGRKKGKEEGKEEGIYETAKNAIVEGFPNEIIKKITKLTDGQIDKIRIELKN
jgi:predicted transposase/invertase (TIGR01784 family)